MDNQQQLSALRVAIAHDQPVATVQLLSIADADGKSGLHWALERPNDIEVIKMLLSVCPAALISVVGGVNVVSYFRSLPA